MSEVIASGDPIQNGAADKKPRPKRRTAVLVVHGMGSQRPLDTVRGVIDAVWLDKDDKPGKGDKRYWLHPERKNDDIDLSVLTTSDVAGTDDDRSVDFHELYWAHLMSETRAVAVLLWLFELVRKGPRLKPGMRALWWGATIFLCLLVQSGVLLVLHAILQFLGGPPLISDNEILFGTLNQSIDINLRNYAYHEPEALLLAPFFVMFMATFPRPGFFDHSRRVEDHDRSRRARLVFRVIFLFRRQRPPPLDLDFDGDIQAASPVRPENADDAVSPDSPFLLRRRDRDGRMGRARNGRDLRALLVLLFALSEREMAVGSGSSLSLSSASELDLLEPERAVQRRHRVRDHRDLPGALRSVPAAVSRRCRKIFSCVARKRAGQAQDPERGGRYARHPDKWGSYDRIVIVAHSLGTVVAYDMLRAYFSRINNKLPDSALLEPLFSAIDGHDPNHPAGEIKTDTDFRTAGRELVRKIAAQTVNSSNPGNQKLPTWLVTDFITLGSPLTHAYYLMCNSPTEDKLFDRATQEKLIDDFDRRVEQREFQTCPPHKGDDDGLLSFVNSGTGKKEFHHAALFGLTRWTNLFFPMSQMFWGDAIGGPLRDIFGRYVKDVPVSTVISGKPSFFTHTSYWNITGPMGRKSPQILELRKQVNLEDRPV